MSTLEAYGRGGVHEAPSIAPGRPTDGGLLRHGGRTASSDGACSMCPRAAAAVEKPSTGVNARYGTRDPSSRRTRTSPTGTPRSLRRPFVPASTRPPTSNRRSPLMNEYGQPHLSRGVRRHAVDFRDKVLRRVLRTSARRSFRASGTCHGQRLYVFERVGDPKRLRPLVVAPGEGGPDRQELGGCPACGGHHARRDHDGQARSCASSPRIPARMSWPPLCGKSAVVERSLLHARLDNGPSTCAAAPRSD